MNTLIAYRTRYGTAADAAAMLKECLGGAVELVDLKRGPTPSLSGRDLVIIGGSIYAGRIQPEVHRFCERNRQALLGMPVGLYICCLYEGETARAELGENFPPWLTAHAFAALPLGGRLLMNGLGFVDRLLVKKVAGRNKDVDSLHADSVQELCRAARDAASDL